MTPVLPSSAGSSPKRVFCLFAHPDDESYSVAGTLALCVKNAAKVFIVFATRGEAGCDYEHGFSQGVVLGQKRTLEAQQACRVLGANPPLFLDLPDGDLSGVDDSSAQALVSDLLRRIEPHLVLGLGPDGAYGHKDHLCCYRWLNQAISDIPARMRPRSLWAAFPRGVFASLNTRLRHSHAAKFIENLRSEDIGVPEGKLDLKIDVSEVLDIKRSVLACHRSQLPNGKIESFLLYPPIVSFFATEMFVHAYGKVLSAGTNNPLDGL